MSRRTEPVDEISPEERDTLASLDIFGVVAYARDTLGIPVNEAIARRASMSGALPYVRIGRKFHYSRRAVRQWLSQRPLPGGADQ